MICENKWIELKERMKKLNIRDEDLEEKFITGSGKGGQKLQKTSSTVYLHHLPTHIEVKCQKHRMREDNRFFARRQLCEKLEETLLGKKSPQSIEREKIRKQKKRRTRRSPLAEDLADS